MELNTVLFAGIGAGLFVGMLLGIGLMCWLLMARNDPISAEEDPDTHAQMPAWPPLPEELGCPPCNGNCNQGRSCPAGRVS
jgi:hypothetical protein